VKAELIFCSAGTLLLRQGIERMVPMLRQFAIFAITSSIMKLAAHEKVIAEIARANYRQHRNHSFNTWME
jgi:hypothetical protein